MNGAFIALVANLSSVHECADHDLGGVATAGFYLSAGKLQRRPLALENNFRSEMFSVRVMASSLVRWWQFRADFYYYVNLTRQVRVKLYATQ